MVYHKDPNPNTYNMAAHSVLCIMAGHLLIREPAPADAAWLSHLRRLTLSSWTKLLQRGAFLPGQPVHLPSLLGWGCLSCALLVILNCLRKSKGPLPHRVAKIMLVFSLRSLKEVGHSSLQLHSALTMPLSKSVLPPLRTEGLSQAASGSGSEATAPHTLAPLAHTLVAQTG